MFNFIVNILPIHLYSPSMDMVIQIYNFFYQILMPPFSICSPNCNYWDAEYVFTHCTGIICMLQQIPSSVYPVWRHHHLPFILAFFSGFPTTMIVKNNNPTTKETIGTSLKIHPSYLYVITYLVLQTDIVYTFQNIFFFSQR